MVVEDNRYVCVIRKRSDIGDCVEEVIPLPTRDEQGEYLPVTPARVSEALAKVSDGAVFQKLTWKFADTESSSLIALYAVFEGDY